MFLPDSHQTYILPQARPPNYHLPFLRTGSTLFGLNFILMGIIFEILGLDEILLHFFSILKSCLGQETESAPALRHRWFHNDTEIIFAVCFCTPFCTLLDSFGLKSSHQKIRYSNKNTGKKQKIVKQNVFRAQAPFKIAFCLF